MKKWVLLILIFGFSNQLFFAQSDEDAFEEWVLFLADTIKNSYAYDEGRLVDSLFAKEAFVEKILIKKEGDKSIKKFNENYYEKEYKDFQLGKLLARKLSSAGYYDFVNYYNSLDGDLHMLFRLAGDNGGLNYHDYQFVYMDSSYKILDLYVYTTGEELSETLGDIYKNELREYLENENRFVKKDKARESINYLKTARALEGEGKIEEAYKVFQKISPEIQKQRLYLTFKIQISGKLGNDSIYLNVLEEFENTYPDNPSLYLHAIGKFSTIEDYDQAIRYINKLDIKVGLDPFLDYMRGNIYYWKKDLINAQKHYEKAYDKFYYKDLYTSMVQVYFETNQEEKFIEMLDALKKDFGYTKDDISEWVETEYPKQAKADKYLAWKKNKTP